MEADSSTHHSTIHDTVCSNMGNSAVADTKPVVAATTQTTTKRKSAGAFDCFDLQVQIYMIATEIVDTNNKYNRPFYNSYDNKIAMRIMKSRCRANPPAGVNHKPTNKLGEERGILRYLRKKDEELRLKGEEETYIATYKRFKLGIETAKSNNSITDTEKSNIDSHCKRVEMI